MIVDTEWGKLKSAMQELADVLTAEMDWKWDGRFGAALAEFSVADQAKVRDILEPRLSTRHDPSTVADAPETVRKVIKHLGGLMPGQALFLSDVKEPAFLYCAWWPWGNGETISIRIAPFNVSLGEDEIGEMVLALRSAFSA